jgi:hypothetical protein
MSEILFSSQALNMVVATAPTTITAVITASHSANACDVFSV